MAYRLIDFNRLRNINGLQDLKQDSSRLVLLREQRTGETERQSVKRGATERAARRQQEASQEENCSPVSLISSILQRLDVLLVVFAVEALHLPSIALVDPSLQCGIIFLEKPRGQPLFAISHHRIMITRVVEGYRE